MTEPKQEVLKLNSVVTDSKLAFELESEVSKHLPMFLANQCSKLTAIAYKKDILGFIDFLKRHVRPLYPYKCLA